MLASSVFIAGRIPLTSMPIKFRCPNCRQFLGISRSKAGTLTDCPTCGHSIRVPALDGTVAPLPEPELNLRDAGLAKALDVLAQLDGPDFQAAQAAALAVKPASSAAPASLHGGVSSSPAVVEAPVRPAPQVMAAPVVTRTPPRDVAVVDRPPAKPAVAEAASGSKGLAGALNELNAVVESYPPRYRQAADRQTVRPAGLNLPWWAAIAGVVVAAGLGFLVGRVSAPGTAPVALNPAAPTPEGPAAPTAPEGNVAKGDAGTAPVPMPPAATIVPAAPGMAEFRSALTGRVTYTNENGESRPDEGARVLVFPETRQGSGKLPVVGFLAGAGEADYRLSKASLRAIGGDFAVADDSGNFEVALPAAGSYQVLIISRYQDQKDAPTLENSLRKVLDSYFDRPNRVIGQVKHYFDTFRFDGAAPSTKGHGFTR